MILGMFLLLLAIVAIIIVLRIIKYGLDKMPFALDAEAKNIILMIFGFLGLILVVYLGYLAFTGGLGWDIFGLPPGRRLP